MEHQRDGADELDAVGFRTELARLVEEARHDGTTISGAYDVRTPVTDEPDYTVEISEVTKRTLRLDNEP